MKTIQYKAPRGGHEFDSPEWHVFITAITEMPPKEREDFHKLFAERRENGIEHFDIVFNVNGVDLPFDKAMQSWYERMNNRINELALKKAKEMVTAAGFEPLMEVMHDAKYNIMKKLEEVTGMEFNEDDYSR